MATPHTLVALAPALLAATLAAHAQGRRDPVATGAGGPAAISHTPPPGVPTYTVIPMATLSDQHSYGTAFDVDPSFDPSRSTTRPVMVGGSFADFMGMVSVVHAVAYSSSGAVLDLGVPGASQALGMNSRGTVVGTIGSGAFRYRRRLLGRGSWTILPGVGNAHTVAMAVNSHDIVVGYDSNGWGDSKALYWTPDDQVHELAIGSGELSDINDEDVVAGYLFSGSAFTMKLDGGGPTLLPAPLRRTPCWAEAINDAGDVVGEFSRFGAMQPVLWSRGEAIPLPVIPNEGTGGARAFDINNRGVIVGNSNWGKAVVWWIDGAIYDLNELTPDYAPFLSNAQAINDQGVIACQSGNRAVLLIPNP